MNFSRSIYTLVFCGLMISPAAQAEPWDSVARFAGGLAGDVVKNYFKPYLKRSDVDYLNKRIDVLEYKYQQYDISSGKPYNYKEVGDLIISLNNMTLALTGRVGNLEGKVASLEERIAALEKLQAKPVYVAKPVDSNHIAKHAEASTPSASDTTVAEVDNSDYYQPDPLPEENPAAVDCETTTDVSNLFYCYSPEVSAKSGDEVDWEAVYQSLFKKKS